VVQLGSVVTFLDHLRRPITEKDRMPGPIPYYGANGQQDAVAESLFDEPLVLLAEDGGHFDEPSRGVAYRIDGPSWVNNHAHVLRPRDSIDVAYLGRVLENRDLRSFVSGSTRGKLTKSSAERIPIPLPPLLEQHRIAAILDQADGILRMRAETLRRLADLSDSLFFEAFGDPLAHSTDARARPLDEVVERIIDCPHTTPSWTASGVVCIRTSNLARGEWDFSETRYVSESTHGVRTARATLEPGDIVLSREGTIGVAAIVPAGSVMSMGQRLVQVRPNREVTEPEFLLAYLLEALRPERLKKLMVGSTSQHLNVKDLRNLRVLVPSRDEQELFARQMKLLGAQRLLQEEHLRLAKGAFVALANDVFNNAS
jgi:type I restriction enzyme S subunit